MVDANPIEKARTLECPRCKAGVEMTEICSITSFDSMFIIRCPKCGAVARGESFEDVFKAWQGHGKDMHDAVKKMLD